MKESTQFRGCGTALVTPFTVDNSLDEARFRKLVRRQIDAGINFLVPCGTTGESPTLTPKEHLRVVEITLEEAGGRVPVLAGAGGNNTAEVIEMAIHCQKLGVDGILSVTPYYNKPTQEGLFEHYAAIAAAIDLPIILYSVQPRTNVNIDVATVEKLAHIDNIVGIKEASGNVGQMASICARVPEDFVVLSGDDLLTLPVISLGGKGLISVASNQIPAEMTELTRLGNSGDFAGARAIQKKFARLLEINFIEASPGPVKFAMAEMDLLLPYYRLPIVLPREESQAKIKAVLKECGLLGERSLTGVL